MLPEGLIKVAKETLRKEGCFAKENCKLCHGSGYCEASKTLCFCVYKWTTDKAPSMKTAQHLYEAVREYIIRNSSQRK